MPAPLAPYFCMGITEGAHGMRRGVPRLANEGAEARALHAEVATGGGRQGQQDEGALVEEEAKYGTLSSPDDGDSSVEY